MYASFFGLKQAPFSIAPDPRYLFMSERHREALAHLLYGVQGGGGFVLLTGEIGAGKTTVCRALLEQIPPHCRVAYVFNPKLTVVDLLKTICHEFHVEVRADGPGPATIKDYLDPLNEYLLRSHAAGQQNLLIIDEAQNLTPHVLEQLRLLTNLETSERKLLQIILIGQPELRKLVARPELEQLAQRVVARYHLDALDEAETSAYVRHRLQVAGLNGPAPFGEPALRRIHRLSRGVPRRINLLCDRALLGAYASGSAQVTPAMVDKAAVEVFDSSGPSAPPARTVPRWLRQPWAVLGVGAAGGALAATAVLLLAGRLGSAPSAPPAPAPLAAAPAAPATALPAQPPASAPAVAASVPVTAPPAVASGPAPDLPPLQRPPAGALLRSETAAWQQLAGLWGETLDGTEPCASAAKRQLQCFRTARMTLNGLQRLDRPAILTLHLPGQAPLRALVVSSQTDSVTLAAGDQRWRLSPGLLAEVWRGEYATLWRTPPGTRGRFSEAADPDTVAWIDRHFIDLQASGRLDRSAGSYSARLSAFQAAQGLESASKAGPLTLMQLNLAIGLPEPRLQAP
jgi:general secretion pathway protein A